SLFVPIFFTVTAAPATTSLFGLVTTPPIEPVVVDCANAIALKANTIRPMNKNLTLFAIQGNSLETFKKDLKLNLKEISLAYFGNHCAESKSTSKPLTRPPINSRIWILIGKSQDTS